MSNDQSSDDDLEYSRDDVLDRIFGT